MEFQVVKWTALHFIELMLGLYMLNFYQFNTYAIALHHKNCAITRKHRNCTNIVLCNITIF